MTLPDALRLTASVHRTWIGSTEYWAFELPRDGQPGRMRSGCNTRWRPWHPLSSEQTDELIALCEATLAQPDPGAERPRLAVDGSAMKIRLHGLGKGLVVEDCIPLEGWPHPGQPPPTSPLLRLVAMINRRDWPDRAPLEERRPVMGVVTDEGPGPFDPTCTLELMPPAWFERSDTGSVLFRLPGSWAPSPAQAPLLDGLVFVAKPELHLTLLSTKESEALSARLPEAAWCEVFESLDWTLTTSGKAVLLKEAKPSGLEYSLVTPVVCPAVNAFRGRLHAMSGVALADTVPHVTLWVRPTGRGIGIESVNQYNDCFVRKLEPGEAAPFLQDTPFAPRTPDFEMRRMKP